jgi:hypothetical protein
MPDLIGFALFGAVLAMGAIGAGFVIAAIEIEDAERVK